MRSLCGLCVALVALVAGAVHAGVVTDGTVGPRVQLNGDFEIGADLGRRAGHNLFHSFERFSLETGERATFSGPDQIRNLISRVTGGERSEINGTLRSTIPGADFYFLNPAGVMFGPNASLDLLGSFHVSTADELRFADGAAFSADNPAGSSLTVAAPEAFGFLGARPAAITVDSASLAVPEGRGLSLVGGDLRVASPSAFTDNLSAPGGRISLVSAASPGKVAIRSAAVEASRLGRIALTDFAGLDTSGAGGGGIRIRGGQIVIEDARITSETFGDRDGQPVSVLGDEVRLENGTVRTVTRGIGDAGPIRVEAAHVILTGGAAIASTTFDQGAGGAVKVVTKELSVTEGSEISAFAGFGSGSGGNLAIAADEAITVSGPGSALRAESAQFSSGEGGRLTITGPRARLELSDGAVISASPVGTGDGGDVVLNLGNLVLTGGADIRTATFGSGAAGDLNVTANESIKVLSEDSALFSGTGLDSPGRAGNMRLEAPQVEVAGGFVSTSTAEGSPGATDDLVIVADTVTISDDAIVGTPRLTSVRQAT